MECTILDPVRVATVAWYVFYWLDMNIFDKIGRKAGPVLDFELFDYIRCSLQTANNVWRPEMGQPEM